jgi:lipopolysaccharide cholinephosphotransferase
VIRFIWSPVSLNWVNRKFDDTLKKYMNENTRETGAIGTGRLSFDEESMDRVFFGKPVRKEFEGCLFNVPEQYDNWLKHVYGDYMKLPPQQDQDEGYLYFEKAVF